MLSLVFKSFCRFYNYGSLPFNDKKIIINNLLEDEQLFSPVFVTTTRTKDGLLLSELASNAV